MRTAEDFSPIAVTFLAGMLLPVLLVIVNPDVLELYLSGRQFTTLAAVTFGLFAWAILAALDLSRVNFLLGSAILPWIVTIALAIAAVLLQHDSFGYLFWEIEDLFVYAATYAAAGLSVVALQRGADRLSEEHDRVPAPRTVAVGGIVGVALVVVAFGGAAYVTASSASVSSVEPGVVDDAGHPTPSLNVTVAGEPTELRLTVAAPDESTTTYRIPRSDMRDGSSTVPLEFWLFDGYEPQAGTYRITVTSLPGVSVDTATYTIENAPSPSIEVVETAAPGEDLDLDLPSDSRESRPDDRTETRVGVAVENRGDVAHRFAVQLLVEDDRFVGSDLFVEPGRQSGQVFAIPDEDVEGIHEEAGETLAVEVAYFDERVTEEVELPAQ